MKAIRYVSSVLKFNPLIVTTVFTATNLSVIDTIIGGLNIGIYDYGYRVIGATDYW